MEQANISSSRDWPLVLSLLGAYIIIVACSNYLLISDELYYASLANQMTDEQIRLLLDGSKEWVWLGYFFLPVFLLGKLLVVSAVLAVGYYAFTNEWNFRPFFRTAIIAEFVMLLPAIIKIVWFSWFHPSYSLDDLQNFVPFSLRSLVNLDITERWLRYPLQTASLFEVAYCLVLIIGTHQLAQLRWGQATRLVGFSYLPALLVWVLLIMFLSISSS
jgi:hypothetical protein